MPVAIQRADMGKKVADLFTLEQGCQRIILLWGVWLPDPGMLCPDGVLMLVEVRATKAGHSGVEPPPEDAHQHYRECQSNTHCAQQPPVPAAFMDRPVDSPGRPGFPDRWQALHLSRSPFFLAARLCV